MDCGRHSLTTHPACAHLNAWAGAHTPSCCTPSTHPLSAPAAPESADASVPPQSRHAPRHRQRPQQTPAQKQLPPICCARPAPACSAASPPGPDGPQTRRPGLAGPPWRHGQHEPAPAGGGMRRRGAAQWVPAKDRMACKQRAGPCCSSMVTSGRASGRVDGVCRGGARKPGVGRSCCYLPGQCTVCFKGAKLWANHASIT